MAEKVENAVRAPRYRGRIEQVGICFVRLLRMFVYQNDWKLLPMSVIIAGLVSLVVRNDFFVTMEGTLKGALALSCVAIWNGCFNSVQVICREREIIKREHRSGMHISSYIVSHMMYQALLCLVQSGLTIYICIVMGIKFPSKGILTPLMIFDVGITVFLISYSSDMIALWISTLVHNTTTAMSIMPFLLITQLVFSGGIFTLPAWSDGISKLMISNYGVKCIAAQADYNNLPMATAWNTLVKLKDTTIEGSFSLEQLMDMVGPGNDDEIIRAVRSKSADQLTMSVLQLVAPDDAESMMEFLRSAAGSELFERNKDKAMHVKVSVWSIIKFIGEDTVSDFLRNKAAITQQKPYYEKESKLIAGYWLRFIIFILAFGALSVITLEFIDKDKR